MAASSNHTNTEPLSAPATQAPATATLPKTPTTHSDPSPGKSGDFVPLLTRDEPANFFRTGGTSPIEYSAREVNASIQVYKFRTFSEDIRATFQQTLLRDWIDPRYREGRLAGPPTISTNSMPGADAVLVASYQEYNIGIAKPRLRILILASTSTAIIDARANDTTCCQQISPSLDAMLPSVRVKTKAAPPSIEGSPGPAGATLAGLYMGFKQKYTVNFFGRVDSGHYVDALHYYLFSANVDVYRRYDFPPEPNGN